MKIVIWLEKCVRLSYVKSLSELTNSTVLTRESESFYITRPYILGKERGPAYRNYCHIRNSSWEEKRDLNHSKKTVIGRATTGEIRPIAKKRKKKKKQ